MKIELQHIKVRDVVENYANNDEEGADNVSLIHKLQALSRLPLRAGAGRYSRSRAIKIAQHLKMLRFF